MKNECICVGCTHLSYNLTQNVYRCLHPKRDYLINERKMATRTLFASTDSKKGYKSPKRLLTFCPILAKK